MSSFSSKLKEAWKHRESQGNVCIVCGASGKALAHHVMQYAQDKAASLPDGFVPMSASFSTIRGNFPVCDDCAPACDQCGLPIVTDKVKLTFDDLHDHLDSEESPLLWGNGICSHHGHHEVITESRRFETSAREKSGDDSSSVLARIESIIRWTTFLPVALVVSFLVYPLVMAINKMLPFEHWFANTFLGGILAVGMASAASASTLVWVGATISPSNRDNVAFFLAALYILVGAISITLFPSASNNVNISLAELIACFMFGSLSAYKTSKSFH